MKRRIVLCADDYGQAPAISHGIIDLVQKGRLSAASCMVNTAFWAEHAGWLAPFKGRIDIGLHFNLTEGSPLSSRFQETNGGKLPALPRMLLNSTLRRLDQAAIEAELDAQLDRFEEMLGCAPDFIDGHQHVHQFPVVRTALLNVYRRRFSGSAARPYIRLVSEAVKFSDIIHEPKKMIIFLSGSRALKRLLDENNIKYNHSFAGIYSFDLADRYPAFFRRFLSASGNDGIIMCHPGLASSGGPDSIAASRFAEYQYLSSDQFLIDCNKNDTVLGRFGKGA